MQVRPASENRPRDERILAELGRAGGGRIGFQALRRSLSLHPQALARTLRHLQAAGLVDRDGTGYRLLRPVAEPPQVPMVPAHPVFAALLPPFIDPKVLADRLARRWFQGLRWYGILEEGAERVLVWTTEGQAAHVRVRFADRLVGIEVQPMQAGVEAFAHVAPLMGALATYYGDAAKAAFDVRRPAG